MLARNMTQPIVQPRLATVEILPIMGSS
jgi:hypothetical protein